jgi:hypothetical protein
MCIILSILCYSCGDRAAVDDFQPRVADCHGRMFRAQTKKAQCVQNSSCVVGLSHKLALRADCFVKLRHTSLLCNLHHTLLSMDLLKQSAGERAGRCCKLLHLLQCERPHDEAERCLHLRIGISGNAINHGGLHAMGTITSHRAVVTTW